MLSRTSSTTTPGRARIALAALVATSVMAALLLGGLVAQAQSDRGAVPNLRLSSASPGELTISWDAPDPAPSDYRVIWAKQDLGFLSYRLSNEANRGNEYPGGNATSITLTGLTKGETFKVLVRARYTSGGNNGGPWSGPWTATATARVQEDPPPEPQPTPASTPQPPEPQPTPASTPQPPPAPTGLTASQVAHDSVTLTWTAPTEAPHDYRLAWGLNGGYISYKASNTSTAGNAYPGGSATSYTITGLDPGTYNVKLRARYAGSAGPWKAASSVVVTGDAPPVVVVAPDPTAEPTAEPEPPTSEQQQADPPPAPTGLTASQVAHDSVTLTWTAPSPGTVTGYRVLRGTDANSLSAIAQDTGNAGAEYTDSTVAAETTYYYAVLALSQNGDGAQSAAVSATTPAPPKKGKDNRVSPRQTVLTTTLVSNTGQTESTGTGSAGGTSFDAQQFTTGSNADGYSLSAIVVKIKRASIATPAFALHQSTTVSGVDVPGTKVVDLSGSVATAGEQSFTPVSATTLSGASTKYFVVVAGSGGGITTSLATSGNEDSGGSPGWSIADNILFSTDSGSTWTSSASPLKIAVKGTAVATDTTAPATGVPAITAANAFRVPGVLTAGSGTIADTDGLPAENTFTWQWVRVDGATETNITGATAATYTLTDDDAGKTIKVKARFTDNGGNAEGPLTSAATSTITAAATCNAPSYPAIEKQIWTGKVTVHALLSNPRGLPQFRGFKSGSESIFRTSFQSGGELGNSRLPVGGIDYFINVAGVTSAPWAYYLYFLAAPAMSETIRGQLTLYVCDSPFPFRDATPDGQGVYWPGLNWDDQAERTLYITRELQEPVRHEPAGADFSHDGDTRGFVSVGTVSSGRMSYPEDGDPWADYGDPGWGDMFRLVGLEPRKTYRVEVDFNRVANTVGGSIQMYICCNHGPDPYAVSEWDSNYDGRAIFDFDTGWTVGATFVSVIPSNSMNPDGWEFGSYTVTLTDVTGLRRLVSNTRQRPIELGYVQVGVVSGLNVQQATSFRTGSNPNGYTLDRVTAYIERIFLSTTFSGVPQVAIHSNATGNLPGAKLCDLQMLADYETGLSLSNGDWPDRLYAPDCADNTLAASTTYWVVFSEESSPAGSYFVSATNSTNEDPRSASGWRIGDDYYQKVGTGAWAVVAGSNPLAIGVYGTPK